MKKFLFVLMFYVVQAQAQVPWKDNAYNYDNSQYNLANTTYDFNNSPYNFKNSEYNYNSINGVYDNGKRVGYEVTNSYGVTNVFDNNGNRIGYTRERH